MSTQENINKVRELYTAFSSGDMKTLFAGMDENVDWEQFGPTTLPTTGPHKGRQGLEKFFAAVSEYYAFDKFEPQEFIAQDDKVVALGYYAGKVKTTRKPFQAHWAMVYTLRNGRVVKFREYTDTAVLEAALER